MEILLAVVIVLLLILLFVNISGHRSWGKRFMPGTIKLMVTPTNPSVAVATPANSDGTGVAASASSPPAAAAAAVKEAMSSNKWTKAWL